MCDKNTPKNPSQKPHPKNDADQFIQIGDAAMSFLNKLQTKRGK